jgi:hypothetical protein
MSDAVVPTGLFGSARKARVYDGSGTPGSLLASSVRIVDQDIGEGSESTSLDVESTASESTADAGVIIARP